MSLLLAASPPASPTPARPTPARPTPARPRPAKDAHNQDLSDFIIEGNDRHDSPKKKKNSWRGRVPVPYDFNLDPTVLC